jgi:hypothetical protein
MPHAAERIGAVRNALRQLALSISAAARVNR